MDGDEEEDDIDDLENEFNYEGRSKQDMQRALAADAMLHGHMSYGRASDSDFPQVFHPLPQVPLLTNGQMVFLLLISLYFDIQPCPLEVTTHLGLIVHLLLEFYFFC